MLCEATCVCDQLQVIQAPLQVSIIRHRRLSRGSNSARILAHSIADTTVIDHGSRYAEPTRLSEDFLAMGSCCFQCLRSRSKSSTGGMEWTVYTERIVLDGSWKQTSRMLKKIQGLTALPRISVQPLDPRIRKPYFEGGMCTMEASISALQHFLPPQQIIN